MADRLAGCCCQLVHWQSIWISRGKSSLGSKKHLTEWHWSQQCLLLCIMPMRSHNTSPDLVLRNGTLTSASAHEQVAPRCLKLDRELAENGDSQGMQRLRELLEAHMWPGLILKDQNKTGVHSKCLHTALRCSVRYIEIWHVCIYVSKPLLQTMMSFLMNTAFLRRPGKKCSFIRATEQRIAQYGSWRSSQRRIHPVKQAWKSRAQQRW